MYNPLHRFWAGHATLHDEVQSEHTTVSAFVLVGWHISTVFYERAVVVANSDVHPAQTRCFFALVERHGQRARTKELLQMPVVPRPAN